jgi:hypothetical protein
MLKQISLMKEAVILFLAFVVITTTGFTRDDYVITKITPSLVATPEFGGGKRRGGDDKWLQVEVDFKSNVDLTDELTFNYYVLYARKCLVGEVTYISVFKGRELHSVMYISPRALKRLNEGKYVSLNPLENITVQILSKGEAVAEKSLKDVRGDWWKTMEAVKGVVVKKSETPFAWVDWDNYEEIKPETH